MDGFGDPGSLVVAVVCLVVVKVLLEAFQVDILVFQQFLVDRMLQMVAVICCVGERMLLGAYIYVLWVIVRLLILRPRWSLGCWWVVAMQSMSGLVPNMQISAGITILHDITHFLCLQGEGSL